MKKRRFVRSATKPIQLGAEDRARAKVLLKQALYGALGMDDGREATTKRKPAPVDLVELAAMRVNAAPYEQNEIRDVIQQTIEAMKLRLLEGQSIRLPGLGILDVRVRGSRIVSANYESAARKYKSGRRPYVHFVMAERYRRRFRRTCRALEWEEDR